MTEEPDETDFPACCFCDKKYGSDACLQCPAYDFSHEEEFDDDDEFWEDEDWDD